MCCVCVCSYFGRVEEISKPDYVPTVQDILHSRSKTTGITEIEFEYENTKFRMVDVGGQRSERKKWIHCFQVFFSLSFFTLSLSLFIT
jgi:hypothetical protein